MGKSAVYILPNGKPLGAKDFNRYFEKKVLYTIRKYGMPRDAKIKKSDNLNSKVLLDLYSRFGFIKPSSKSIALDDSADDVASGVVESWFEDMRSNFSPSSKGKSRPLGRPLFLMTDEEIKIYASLKRIKGKDKKKSPARLMLDKMEKPHPEVKRAIVQSYLQILEIMNKSKSPK